VLTKENVRKGDFVAEYVGKVISTEEGDLIKDKTYLYFFENSFVSLFSIDASTTDRIAKYIRNSSKKESNCIPRPCFMAGMPRVLFYASKEIDAGSELRCYYGFIKKCKFHI
jgi:SET domain-containing protein